MRRLGGFAESGYVEPLIHHLRAGAVGVQKGTADEVGAIIVRTVKVHIGTSSDC